MNSIDSKAPKAALEDTGERMVPEYHKKTFVHDEHINRYLVAKDLVKGKTILDIASGSGYGSSILAQTAKKVIGVDNNSSAVRYASDNYKAKNLNFMVGDAIKIPLEDNSLEIVTSFETIEHIADYNRFMEEVKRVLKPDGLFVISTPNVREFAKGNHFHLHEFEHKELLSLIHKYFKNTKDYFQGTWVFNAIVDEQILSKEISVEMPVTQLGPISTNKVLYFYILCSNREITETLAPSGVISQHWSAKAQQERDQEINTKVKRLTKEASILGERLMTRQEELKTVEAEMNDIVNSKSFRLSRRMSWAVSKVKPKSKAK